MMLLEGGILCQRASGVLAPAISPAKSASWPHLRLKLAPSPVLAAAATITTPLETIAATSLPPSAPAPSSSQLCTCYNLEQASADTRVYAYISTLHETARSSVRLMRDTATGELVVLKRLQNLQNGPQCKSVPAAASSLPWSSIDCFHSVPDTNDWTFTISRGPTASSPGTCDTHASRQLNSNHLVRARTESSAHHTQGIPSMHQQQVIF